MNYCYDDKLEIVGGNRLFGTFKNQTSKNAVLPIMSASIMAEGVVEIRQVPDILDVTNMKKILRKLGVKVTKKKDSLLLDSSKISRFQVDENLSKTMRSSIFLLGALLSRFKEAHITFPGGCKIGNRPIDLHIDALKKLNVKVIEDESGFFFDGRSAKPNKIKLKIPSVGATENIVQFAVKLKGITEIFNPAREPEVVDLCNFLNSMGAKIVGAGTKKITIYGVDSLFGIQYTPIKDRIVSGTIMIATALTKGKVTIIDGCAKENESLIKILSSIGCKIDLENDIIKVSREGELKNINIVTGYFPKFPTDLQSIILPLLCVAEGNSKVQELVFENRFLIAKELNRMGANISLSNAHTALVRGLSALRGRTVKATDLRGGAGLVLAGLIAKGKTIISDVNFIDRGYDHIEHMLSSLGANIRRVCQKQKSR